MNTAGHAPIRLAEHTSLIYVEGVFGKKGRARFPLRAKTADGILRYATYPIAGIVDSQKSAQEHTAQDVLGQYLAGTQNKNVPIYSSLKDACAQTHAHVLILGAAPEGGELPQEWDDDILWALKNGMHVVSGMHYALKDNASFCKTAQKGSAIIWDVRTDVDIAKIPICTAQAYHIKKPIVLTVGTDAAIGKMTVAYELMRAAQAQDVRACLIPTGQTSIMIEGWGIAVDALPADFMAGAVEKMILERQNSYDAFFVEGQGSIFHPAFSNTCISLLHGAVPTHMVLVHRPMRKHSIGSKLVPLPSLTEAIKKYEALVLPAYRDAKVIAVALNSFGMSDEDYHGAVEQAKKETGLLIGDTIRDHSFAERVAERIFSS